MKLTKRKGFNFFRSYYDVYNELSDKDKLSFMDALLDRQFIGVKPADLKGMAKFAYISQAHSIDSQVKGYEDKTGIKLSNTPTDGGTEGGTQGGNLTPTEQVEEEEEGKGEEQHELTPTQKVLDFVESDYDENLVGGFKRFTEFIEKTKHVKNIPSQINITSYQKICDEHTVDKLKQKIGELDNWLDDPNIAKGKKKKKSLTHLMLNTWMKNSY